MGTSVFLGAELVLALIMDDSNNGSTCPDGPYATQVVLHISRDVILFSLLFNPLIDPIIVLWVVPAYKEALFGNKQQVQVTPVIHLNHTLSGRRNIRQN